MKYKLLPFLFSFFLFFGCEKSDKIEDYLYSTWELEWKQCGLYQNKYDIKMNFSQTDSSKTGWYKEQFGDTINFDFVVIDNENILINSTDSIWNGNLFIAEFKKGRLVFEKEYKECENEVYKFR